MGIKIEDFREKQKQIDAFDALFAKHEHLIVDPEDFREEAEKKIISIVMDLDSELHLAQISHYLNRRNCVRSVGRYLCDDIKPFISAFVSEYYVGFNISFKPNEIGKLTLILS